MTRNVRYSNGSARRKMRARVLAEEDLCHLCDQAVDVRLPHGLPGSPEVDEVIPVAYGGDPLNRAGARLAHRYCNRLRSTQLVFAARLRLAEDRPRFGADGRLLDTAPRATVSRQWL